MSTGQQKSALNIVMGALTFGEKGKEGVRVYELDDVKAILDVFQKHGHYDGIYNAVHRAVEPELFPCLRKFGIAFYEYNPLGGGFFAGRYHSLDDNSAASDPGSRFDPNTMIGKSYRKHYWQEPYFRTLAKIEAAAQAHGLTLAEVALRWLSHHSLLKREHGDAVTIGTSSLKHIGQNLVDIEKGPLPEEVVKILDEAWLEVSPYASKYYH